MSTTSFGCHLSFLTNQDQLVQHPTRIHDSIRDNHTALLNRVESYASRLITLRPLLSTFQPLTFRGDVASRGSFYRHFHCYYLFYFSVLTACLTPFHCLTLQSFHLLSPYSLHLTNTRVSQYLDFHPFQWNILESFVILFFHLSVTCTFRIPIKVNWSSLSGIFYSIIFWKL